MSAQNGVIAYLKSRTMMNCFFAVLLSFLIPLQPLVPAIAYAMADDLVQYGSQQGQDLWKQIQSTTAFPQTSGGTQVQLSNGEKVGVNELFQAPKQDDSYKTMYTLSEGEFEQRGLDGREKLILNDKSAEGQAYRTLRESAYVSRPDLNNDPLWGSTDAVYDFLAGQPVDCTGDDTHTPDYRTCERINLDMDACTINHDYDIGVFEHLNGPVNMASCGEGCMDFWLGKIGDNYYSGNCKIYEEAMSIKMLNPDAILDAKIVYAKWDDYMQIWIGGDKAWAGPNNNFPPETSGACELGTSWEKNPNKDVTSFFRDRERNEVVDMKVRVSVTGGGEGYAKIRLYYDPSKIVNKDEWSSPACAAKAKIYQSKYGSSGATCDRMPTLNAQGCYSKNGVTACPSAFEESPVPGISPLCQKVSVRTPDAVKAANTCDQYQNNPTCGFITSTCDGKTPQELITDLYVVGLGRQPDAAGLNHWVRVYNEKGGDFEYVRHAFFEAAGLNDEGLVNQFSCSTFVETYDCGFTESANSGACAVQDLFKDDFADCVEELNPKEVTYTVGLQKTESCVEALKLTECTVTRELTPVKRSGGTSYSRGCFITEDVSYRVPWADKAASASVSITTSGLHTSAEILAQPSPANSWTAKLRFNGSGQLVTKTREIGRTCNPGETAPCYTTEEYQVTECPAGSSLNVTLKAEGYAVEVTEKEVAAEEGNAPCLRTSDDWTDTSWTCQAYSPLTINGVTLSGDGLASAVDPMYPGAAATCIKGHATYTTKEYAQGQFCWTNLEGKQECTTVDNTNGVSAGSDTCAPLRQKEQAGECRYDGRFKVEDGDGSTGFQYVWENRYTCTTDTREVTETQIVPEYVCSGIVRCMGDECMTPNREASASFGKAAAMLQAVQQIGQDVTCDASTGADMMRCQVFAGEAQICKQALGSYVDCCESPGGTSLSDYVGAVKGVYKFDNYMMNSESLPQVMEGFQSAYSTIRTPVAAPMEYVGNAFTEVYDNIAAKVTSNAAGEAVGGAVEAVKSAYSAFQQTMMSAANTAMKEMFGDQVAGMFFEQTANGVAMTAGFAAALSIIGLIYTIYQIAKILISIVWKCTEDELGLAVDVDLKKTHYVGSYCAKKTVFGCMERHQSYCVFSSPLSRIINEQARPQLGRGWGTPKNPDCSGITLEELTRLDWNQIDLGEWMDILKVTDNMPGMRDLTLDGMTGEGSYLGELAAKEGETRPDTAERNGQRLDGVDLGKLNQKAADEMWRTQ